MCVCVCVGVGVGGWVDEWVSGWVYMCVCVCVCVHACVLEVQVHGYTHTNRTMIRLTNFPHVSLVVYPNCSFDYCTKNKNSLCLR